MLILKKINNNVALAASDDGREVVVFGKGIGFHEMPYELADESLIQRKFYNVPESLAGYGRHPSRRRFARRERHRLLRIPAAWLQAIRWPALYPGRSPAVCRPARRRPAQRSQSARARGGLHLPARAPDRPGGAWPSCKSTLAPSWARTRPRASRSTSLTPRSMAWAAPRTWTSS